MLGEFFDPKAELLIYDSIPREVIDRWEREKREWLAARGYEAVLNWSKTVAKLSAKDRADFHRHFDRCREEYLDTCHGRCLLRRPDLAKIVADALLRFDGQRYRLGDFVVMPNHVHLLAAFASAASMKEQCDSWLHYTAFRINQAIGGRGKFWQPEPFDHLIRSPEQYEYLRDYIADNPRKACLRVGEFYYRRYDR